MERGSFTAVDTSPALSLVLGLVDTLAFQSSLDLDLFHKPAICTDGSRMNKATQWTGLTRWTGLASCVRERGNHAQFVHAVRVALKTNLQDLIGWNGDDGIRHSAIESSASVRHAEGDGRD